jgi:catechol 2,3-dioxygenase-like lactoylglutathione lyase family enzyme
MQRSGSKEADRRGRLVTVSIRFNHTIVFASDREASAAFFCEVFGLAPPIEESPFLAVTLAHGVTLDFGRMQGRTPSPQHYAFHVDDDELEAILTRVRERAIPFWAEPDGTGPGELNAMNGGRGFYFNDPSGHFLEVLTRPSGVAGLPDTPA